MISHPHRCVFVHIPKTAGNSVNRIFGVQWENHKDLQRYHDEMPAEDFAHYFKFAIVRNPWDRLLSDYNYQVKKSRARASKLFVFAADGSQRNFAEWVEAALASPDCYQPGDWGADVSPHIHRWSPQVDWLTVDGQPRVDFVAHLDRLSEDFRTVFRRLDLPSVPLPHRNRRLHWHYSRYYDSTTRDLVAKYYARDIAAFGFEFERAFLHVAFRWPKPRVLKITPIQPAKAAQAQLAGGRQPPTAVVSSTPTPGPLKPRGWPVGLLVAASCVLLLCSLGFVSTRASDATGAADSPPASLPRSVQRLILGSSATAAGAGDTFFARAHRLSQKTSELHLQWEWQLTAIPSIALVPTVSPTPESISAPQSPAPIAPRFEATPAPRQWLGQVKNRGRLSP